MNAPALQPVIEALGWTLVHFLWQGAMIGIVFALVSRLFGEASSRLRYRAGLLLFLCAGLAPVVTFWLVYETAAGAAAPLGGALLVGAAGGAEAGSLPWWLALENTLEPYLPWAVVLWLAGVIVMSGRVCLDWWQVRRLTWVGVAPLPPHWEEKVAELIRTFGVSRPVRVLRSTIVRVPAVIGWLRPVVLLPTAALAGLSARQLELIIAHELAHIRRADYLVNLLQVVIETVLFYHPAVRWMSNRLRQERELCCVDAVIGTCGDTLTYAQALTELEAQRQQSFQTALAANGGHLSHRIYRMLDRPVPRRNSLIWSMSLVVGLAAGSMAVAAQLALSGASAPAPIAEPRIETPVPAPTPATSSASVGRSDPASAPVFTATAGDVAPASDPQTTDADAAEPDERAGAAIAKSSSAVDDQPNRMAAATQHAGTSRSSSAAPGPVADDDSAKEPGNVTASGSVTAADDGPPPVESQTQPAEAAAADGADGDDRQVRIADAAATGNGGRDRASGNPEPVAAESPPSGATDNEEPIRLAKAIPQQTRASTPPEPVVRGGEPLHVSAPEYPRRARIRGLQGSVTAVFTIGRDGRVHNVEIADSSPAGVFDRAVSDALAEWRFRPLVKDGEPVARRVSKQFEFNLADSSSVKSEDVDSCDPVTGTRICRPWAPAPEELPVR